MREEFINEHAFAKVADKRMLLTRLSIAQEVAVRDPHYPYGESPYDIRARDSGFIDHEQYRLTIPGLEKSVIKEYPLLTQKYSEMGDQPIGLMAARFLHRVYEDKQLPYTYTLSKEHGVEATEKDDEQIFDIGVAFPEEHKEAAELCDRLLWRYVKFNQQRPENKPIHRAAACAFLRIAGVEQREAERITQIPKSHSSGIIWAIARHIKHQDTHRMQILDDVMTPAPRAYRIPRQRTA